MIILEASRMIFNFYLFVTLIEGESNYEGVVNGIDLPNTVTGVLDLPNTVTGELSIRFMIFTLLPFYFNFLLSSPATITFACRLCTLKSFT